MRLVFGFIRSKNFSPKVSTKIAAFLYSINIEINGLLEACGPITLISVDFFGRLVLGSITERFKPRSSKRGITCCALFQLI